jgi:hypothetical protein
MIIPSLLSYTLDELEQKCLKIRAHQDIFRRITSQTPESVQLHLDIVMPDFAVERSVAASTQYRETVQRVQQVFTHERLVMQIHIMGTAAETRQLVSTLLPIADSRYFVQGMPSAGNIKQWYDADQWPPLNSIEPDSLLMTVIAGKGGQTIDPMLSSQIERVSDSVQGVTFDGGLQITQDMPGAMIVVGSDFWNHFDSFA